jgi:Family of unknown function (DUF5681)
VILRQPAANVASDQRPRGRPFAKGVSGNPAGKSPGTKNSATRILEALLEGEAEAVTRAVVDKAKSGELAAAKIILDRILPPRRDRPVVFTVPKIEKAADALTASAAIVEAVASGELTPTEAHEITALLTSHIKLLEAVEFEQRLTALEQARERP